MKNSGGSSKVDLTLERGLLYLAVVNLNNAIEDFDRVIAMDSTNHLAWFARAVARYKMVEIVQGFKAQDPPLAGNLDLSGVQSSGNSIAQQKQKILDYELVLADLERVTELRPEFSFAWFNMGYIKALLRDFSMAKDYFTRAIEVNPDFGEAFFNRGLIRLFLEETTLGTLDLSKAGELGVYEAYSVIKRYGATTLDPGKDVKEKKDD